MGLRRSGSTFPVDFDRTAVSSLCGWSIALQQSEGSCKYTYTEFSAVSTKQDARGVVSTYSYDALHRNRGISYNTVSGVTKAPTVTFIYDYDVNYGTSAPGKLVRVNVGSDYQERYTFDSYLGASSAIRTIGSRTYTTSYNTYNGGKLSCRVDG